MAATYLTPGVYIEEMPSGSMPIQGVSTSVAAFVGFTQTYRPDQGSPDDPDGVKPQLVTSWPQYERIYGGFVDGALLPYAVRGFFENGGGSCYIVRASAGGPAQPPQLQLQSVIRPDVPSLKVEVASDDGARYEIEVVPPVADPDAEPSGDEEFAIRVFRNGELAEEATGISFAKAARSVEKSINDQLTAVRVQLPSAAGVPVAERLPAPGRFALVEPVPEVADPQILQGSEAERTGYEGLSIADNVTIVAIPDLVTVATRPDRSFDVETFLGFQGQLVDWCAASGKRMAVLDPPPGMSATMAVEWRQRLAKDSPFAAAYYPNVVVPNRAASAATGERFITVPPSGHMAGVWARTDATRGVWKAPANEEIRGITGLENPITDGEQAELNPIGVNCLRSFGAGGMRVWGARTLSLTDPSWRYVNVRRLFNFVEESIRLGTQWAVFEPNDRSLWQRVKRNITAFLRGLWMQGALVGATAEQAFYVLCDETNNPPSSVDEGKLVVEIGLCPSKPAEFVIFRIAQWQGGDSTSE
ncbi:phage tail sheath family protein [Propionibacteriaceae bacterium Y2011]